jgi:hypothetical protein
MHSRRSFLAIVAGAIGLTTLRQSPEPRGWKQYRFPDFLTTVTFCESGIPTITTRQIVQAKG